MRGWFDIALGTFEHFGSIIHTEPGKTYLMFDDQNPVLPGQRDFFLAKTFAQINDRHNLPAQVNHALYVIGRVRHSRDLWYPDDFMEGSDRHAVSLVSQLEADNVQFAIHEDVN